MYLLIDIYPCFPIDIKNTSRAAIKHGELLPPDHVPGAHVEQDGHINKDYHHEVFLGEYLIFPSSRPMLWCGIVLIIWNSQLATQISLVDLTPTALVQQSINGRYFPQI